MIREIKGHPPLAGYRGKEPVDIGYLEDLPVKVSEFNNKRPAIYELDLNPVFAYREEA
jgi:acyl-CoA synthetase (NDP forming)